MHIAVVTLEIHIPGSASLKHKRSRLKPLLARLHREFNISAAEIGQHDLHNSTVIACVVVSNDSRHPQRVLAKIPRWIEVNRPDLQIVDEEFSFH
jgi:uncharacterized protein YlxP (DUF503 family)